MREIPWQEVACLISDVDETLIDDKSMLSYLPFLEELHPATKPTEIIARMLRQASREDANAVYYESFRGIPYPLAVQAGRAWFESRRRQEGFWITSTYELIAEARRRGIPVHLVSGSHPFCLTHIARELDAESIICTELEVAEGCLTGVRVTSAIGEAKASRVRALAGRGGLTLDHAVGLGDHESDYPFLRLCRYPLLVTPGGELTELQQANGLSADLPVPPASQVPGVAPAAAT